MENLYLYITDETNTVLVNAFADPNLLLLLTTDETNTVLVNAFADPNLLLLLTSKLTYDW